jgi:hypothetical protein
MRTQKRRAAAGLRANRHGSKRHLSWINSFEGALTLASVREGVVMETGRRRLIAYLSWGFAAVMFCLFVASLVGLFLPLEYGLVALGASAGSAYLAMHGRHFRASHKRRRRIHVETTILAAIILIAVFGGASLTVVLGIYVACVALLVVREAMTVRRRLSERSTR